jgi:hypothetical protein
MSDDARIIETVTTLYEKLFRPDMDRFRGEMEQMEGRLRGETEALRGDMGELAQTLHGEMGELGQSLRGEMAEMGRGLRGDMGQVEQGLRGEMGELGQSLHSDMARMEKRLRGDVRVMQADIATLKQTTAEIQSDAADFHRDSDGHFDAVYQRFDRLETEYHMLVEGLRRVEKEVAAHAALLRP